MHGPGALPCGTLGASEAQETRRKGQLGRATEVCKAFQLALLDWDMALNAWRDVKSDYFMPDIFEQRSRIGRQLLFRLLSNEVHYPNPVTPSNNHLTLPNLDHDSSRSARGAYVEKAQLEAHTVSLFMVPNFMVVDS